jgi:hypothetical protein
MEYIHTLADGSTVKYTEDMIKNVIADKEYYQGRYVTLVKRVDENNNFVYEFFKDRYDSGSDEITVTVEDVNELLESIGSSKLKVLFTVTGTIHFVVTDIEAESEDEARDIVNSDLSVEFNGDGNLDEWDIDISDTSQQ